MILYDFSYQFELPFALWSYMRLMIKFHLNFKDISTELKDNNKNKTEQWKMNYVKKGTQLNSFKWDIKLCKNIDNCVVDVNVSFERTHAWRIHTKCQLLALSASSQIHTHTARVSLFTNLNGLVQGLNSKHIISPHAKLS